MESLSFEWDEDKNRENKRKHGISFETASHVFDDKHRMEFYDEGHSIDEERYISIGLVNRILFVVHTDRGPYVRIISARYADAEERSMYYEQFG